MNYNQAKKALLKICKEGDEKEVKKILDKHPSLINEDLDGDGSTILILASINNHIKIVKLLLSYNIEINKQNKDGNTALHQASDKGSKEIVELLLSHKKININIKGNDGNTALHQASYKGYKEIVELLLSHDNININIKSDDGNTALHKACSSSYGCKEIVELLLSQNNINVNIKDKSSSTPLYSASYYGHKEIVELLLSHPSIGINIKDCRGDTALHAASSRGHKEIVELLLSHNSINIDIKSNDGKLASDICCDGYGADKSNEAIILELFENHSKAKEALMSSSTVAATTSSSHSREGSNNGTVNQKNPNKQTEATITEPTSVTKEPQEHATKESGLVTNQTDVHAINKPSNSGTKEIAEKRDNQTISKPVLGGEQIGKKVRGQVAKKPADLVQTEEEENYMKEALLSGKKEWGRSKIMIVGEGRAGKTALANSILGRKYESTESTVGINEFTCNVGYASVGGRNADGLWSEHKREKQQKEYEVALAKMIFDKKTGREQMKRGEREREEVELELLMGNKNAGGYLQGEEALSKRDEGKGKVDDSVLKRKEVTSHDLHPISKPQNKLVPSSSQSSVLAESFRKESKSIVSNPNAKTSVLQDTVSSHHAVKENEVDSPVKKAEIDKSLVMQYLGEKSCVDSKFVISVFDFGGQSVFNVIHPFFLTRFGVYLLVFNMEWLSSKASMEVKEDCLSYITFWLNSIIIHTQNEKGEVAPIFFVGTRKDLVSSPADHLQISTKLYEVFSGSVAWPYVVENVGAEGPNGRTDLCFYPVNNTLSNHDVTMQSLLKKIEETIDSSSYVHVERPLSWFRVIDALKEANVPYMRYKEAERIITGCDIPENKVSLLLRFLHEMGILMWHDEDKLREVVVFDPIDYFVKPATIVICKHVPDEADGTYHVLDIHRRVRKVHGRDFQQMTRHGIITEKLLKALLQQHEENYMHISQLMLKYGLLVPLTVEQVEDKNVADDDEDDEALYLAPALLPELKRSKEENENKNEREGEGSLSSEFYFLFSASSELGQMTTICLEDCRHLGFLPHGLFEKLISKAMMWSMKTSDFVSLGTLYDGCYKNRAELAFGNQMFRISADPHHHMISVMVDGRNPVGVHDRLVEQLKEIIAECLKSLKFISVLRFDGHDGHCKASHWKTGVGNEGVMFLRLDQIRAVVEKKTALSMNVRGGRSLLNAQEAMKMYDAWLVDYTVFDEYDTFISYRWGERDSEFTLALFDRMTLYAVGESRRSIQAFLDRKRLQMGENFQSGFVKALLKSLVMVPIVSAEALERMTKMRVEEEDNVLIEWICGLECMKAVEKKGSGQGEGEGEIKTRLMKIMPIFFGSRVDGGVKGVGVDEGCCSVSNEPQIRNLFEEKIIDRLPDFVPSGSISKAKTLLESSDVKMSEEGMRITVKEIVKEISRFLSLCAWEVQGKSKGKGKGKGVSEKPLIAHAAESVRAEVESGLMTWQQYVSKHKKKDVHSSHVEMRKNSSEDTNMDKMNVPSSHSVSVQWYEKFGFNERIALACHEIGVDSEEDLLDVFSDDGLYEQLRSKLRPLDQKKVEALRQKLSS